MSNSAQAEHKVKIHFLSLLRRSRCSRRSLRDRIINSHFRSLTLQSSGKVEGDKTNRKNKMQDFSIIFLFVENQLNIKR